MPELATRPVRSRSSRTTRAVCELPCDEVRAREGRGVARNPTVHRAAIRDATQRLGTSVRLQARHQAARAAQLRRAAAHAHHKAGVEYVELS
eukprot:629352-Prymnesium_polylepis.1